MLELRDVSLAYDDFRAVADVSLRLEADSIGCLLGPSGCGKSTVLRGIAGFQRPVAGEVWLDGQCVATPRAALPPERRRVGVVLQHLALFPHLSVAENIGFGLRGDKRARRRRVAELLELTGLGPCESAFPHELSGGQQQRVAVARAMAPRPKLLLLDEPFSSLDPDLRQQLPRELRRILLEDGISALLVTHDQHEAFAMSNRIGVMREGRLEQWDSAYNLYHRPATRFVAGFIGEGVMLPGMVLDGHRVDTELGILANAAPVDQPVGTAVELLVRPDDVLHDDDGPLHGRVVDRTFRGSHFLYTVLLAGGSRVLCLADSHHDHAIDERIGIRPQVDHLVVFPRE